MALRTPLYERHVARGARFLEFGGWDMPLQYAGIVEEHLAVRSAAGLFDVSHMGKLFLEGPGAHAGIDGLSTNDVPGTPGRGRYTHLLDEAGRILDDVIVTCLAPDRFLCVCNAGPRAWVVPWVRARAPGVALRDATPDLLCLALQGPRAAEVLARLSTADLAGIRPFRSAWVPLDRAPPTGVPPPPETMGRGPPPEPILVTRTGYTGEDGFELFPPASHGVWAWEALLAAGSDLGLVPAGLGARDTLRLEKGYLLSGQDFTGRETSLETGSEWLVKWDREFVGRDALLAQKARGGYRRLLGLQMVDRGIPRPGCRVLRGDREAGVVTSGTMSPSLRVGIALAYLEPDSAAPGTEVSVEIRGEPRGAVVAKPPFL